VIAVTEAGNRRIWLETFDPPHLPQLAVSPTPILGTLSMAFAALLFWSFLALLYAGVREHDS
jgi:capsule polysaccharide export protein KpsE/RkpR